jgi:hypothetical protein
MSRPTLTYAFAMMAAQDAGNRAMRRAGRATWAPDDWDTACDEFDRLWHPVLNYDDEQDESNGCT